MALHLLVRAPQRFDRVVLMGPVGVPMRLTPELDAAWGFYDDPIGIKLRYEVGIDHIMWGSDFPHVVTAWPHSRHRLDQQMVGVPDEERRKMLVGNLLEFLGIPES